MMVQVRAHTQWTPSEKKNIFYLILQGFEAVYFCVSGRFETVLYFFPHLGKGLSLLTLILDLKC